MTSPSSPSVTQVLLAANTRHSSITDQIPAIEAAFAKRSVTVQQWNEGDDPDSAVDGIDVVVALGGDGYMMNLMRSLNYPVVPFYGVNHGRVGFLMNEMMEAEELAEVVATNGFRVNSYPVLEGCLKLENGESRVLRAVNDFVLERASGQTVHLRTSIDDVLLNEYSGDGLIVATPGGSTAYSLAAGGPVVHHDVPGMIVTPLNPHRPVQFHSLQFPIFLPLHSTVNVVAEYHDKRPVRCTADGTQVDGVVEMSISDSGRRVTLLRMSDYQFIDTLVRKIIGRREENVEELQE
ncbi:MAG: NAD(+)/NADH kinase [Planctomycetota bacterium]